MIRTIRAAALAVASAAFTAAAILWANPALAQEVPQSVSAFIEAATGTDFAFAPAPRPHGLVALVESYATGTPASLSAEQHCLASAVYFEARGESLEGQLAVAEVVLNRALSGRYPASWCGVVVQRSQFSFVRGGRIPGADRASAAWRRAVAVARIAEERAQRILPQDVLWYHANYVRPSWGRRLSRSSQIGAHIFYR